MSLIGYWPLAGDSGGIARCPTDRALDAVYVGARPFLRWTWFDGGGAYVNLPDEALPVLTERFNGDRGSLTFWMRAPKAGIWVDGLTHPLITIAVSPFQYLAILKPGRSKGGLSFLRKNGLVSTKLGTQGLDDCEPHHAGMAWGNGVMRGYLDGELLGTALINHWTPRPLRAVWFGRRLTAYWHGWMSDVQIWDHTLTTQEMQAHAGL